ncbi:MAG TPA: hypothetical protein VGN57_07485 [Pirellulaceae bacterium]|nr:hypothetical protein [Pirellulaceae bacterium]
MATGYPAASGRVADPASGADAPQVRTAVDSVRGQVKLVETSQAILFGLIVFGLAASLVIYVDAWLLPRQFETSLPDWVRWVALCSLLGWAIWYGLFRVAPVAFRRIHPEYAARLIEGDRPQYKNSLLNLLSLERQREHVPPEALRYLRAQAEQDITKAPIEVVVSPRPAFFMACILVGLVAIGAVATALAPDRMLAGATRLAAPWSEVVPPARVEILAVRPGDVEVPLGSTVVIEAEIVRLAAEDAIAVVYSTDDGQFVDVRVPMAKAEVLDTWKASLPEVGSDGLRRSLKYRVEAGDASSAVFAIKVAPQPTLVAEEVRYEYPPYTRLPSRVERLPSTLRALEGTRATLSLSSNVKIGSARLDLYRTWPDFAGSVAPTVARTVTATSTERTAAASFAIAMSGDATKSEYAAVVPRMTGETGLVNDPLAIPIEAFRDLPPEVTWRAPLTDKIETPLNRSVELQFQALDPDFGLQKVEWFGLREESEVFRVPSLDSPQTSPAPRTFRVRFTPDIFGFKQGERARIAVDAWDGKTTVDGSPAYQRTRSTFIEVTILPPAPGEDPHAEKTPPAGNGQPDGEEGDSGEGAGESQEEGQSGEGGGGGSSGGQGDKGSSGTVGTNASSDEGEGQSEGQGQQSRSTGNSSGGGEEGESSEGEGQSEGSSGGNGQAGESQNANGQGGMPSDGAGAAQGENSMPTDPTQMPPGEADPDAAPSQGEPNSEGANGGSPSAEGASQNANGQGDASQRPAGQGTQGQSSERGMPNQDGGSPSENGGMPRGEGADSQGTGGQAPQNAQGQPQGASSQGEPNGEGGSQDPLHDGEAFEKILEKVQNPPQSGQPQSDQPQSDQPQSGQPQSGQPQSGQPQSGQPQSGQPQSGQPQSGQPQSGQPQSGQPQSGQPQSGQPQSGQPQSGQPQSGQPQSGQPQSGQPQSGQPQSGQPQSGQPQSGQPQSGQPGSEGSQPGAEQGSQPGGQGDSQAGTQPGSQGAESGSQGEEQPGSQGSSGSSSSGQQGGSGSQPQRANPSGADQSQEKEPGQGGAEQKQGEQKQGEQKQGEAEQQGEKAKPAGEQGEQGMPAGGGEKGEGGAGSGTKDQNPYASSGAASKEGEGAAAGSKGDAGGTSGGKPGQSGSKGDSAGGSMGGSSGPGSMGEGNDAATTGEGGVNPATTDIPLPPGEKANLEYSKQATDLVLRYLDDEERRRDPALLKELGWSEAEMESFFAKWKAMKQAAESLPDPGATTPSGDFEDAVRALGLRPRTTAQRSGAARDDSAFGDQIDGAVNQPPIEYLEQFRAFQRARNR